MGETPTAASESSLEEALTSPSINPSAYDESWQEGLNILVYVNVMICLFGICGNILIICVFGRRGFATSSTAVLLQGLACTDMLTLIFEAYLNLTHYLDVEMYQYQITFILSGYCNMAFAQCSNWTLIVVTAERVTAILLPHKTKLIWTKCRCRIILLLEYIIVFLTNLTWIVPWFLSVNPTELFDADSLSAVYGTKDLWVQLLVSCIFPGFLLIVGNSIIVWRLIQRKVMLKKMSQNVQRTSNTKSENVSSSNSTLDLNETQNVINKPSQASFSNTQRCPPGDHEQASAGLKSTSGINAKATGSSLNFILIFISAFFLLSTIPITVYALYLKIVIWPYRIPNQDEAFLYHIIMSLPLLNFSINIVGYSFVGRRFRTELKAMLMPRVRIRF